MSSVVIVGAGECGGRAALELRKRGFEGAIHLIGGEDIPPYERPPLSKEGLRSSAEPRFIASVDEYGSAGIDLHLSTHATRIDRIARTVLTAKGDRFLYDRLLLATGARSRSFPGVDVSDKILVLRSHSDAARIRNHLAPGKRLAIVGGGFIGLELAASARSLGVEVVVFEGQSRLLARNVHELLAEKLRHRHEQAGVTFVLNATIESIKNTEECVVIGHSQGMELRSDLVVIGIGAVPNVELAEDAGLAVNNGIVVDSRLQTSDPLVFAAGDCCNFPCHILNNQPIRLESWRNAQEQALHAAANIVGENANFIGIPWFWSDQYELTLQACGVPDNRLETASRLNDDGSEIIFYLETDGRLLAAAGLGIGNSISRDIRLAEMMIASKAKPDRSQLSDPTTKLKQLLRP
ncbi:MAG: FAD-dependent oxidoreductase [Rhizobiaceae bacterium]|nr:FAD-dependent oxidoreductase [Rhizobiaceae bacterium]MCZ8350965.1 FAD-dependent oxidoreductase [Rhizobium sp.]